MTAPLPSSYQRSLADDWEARLVDFERAWHDRPADGPSPRWQDFLPPAGQPCPPAFRFWVLATDIDCRVEAGLPALLAEPYFNGDHLHQAGSVADAQLLAELVRREYRLRWQRGQRARLRDYLERFPSLGDDLASLVPQLVCPRCGHDNVPLTGEDVEVADCPRCGARVAVTGQPALAEPSTCLPTAPADSSVVDAAASATPQTPPNWPAATPAPPTPSPSRQVGRFMISDEIARGGMGVVLRGHDNQLRREVAVKVLLDEHAGKPELLHRFVEEAQIAGQLQHPGVVPVYEIGRLEDRRPYFAMKLVKGQTLTALLAARKDLSEDLPRFLGIFEHVCQAVAYAHSKRVIHRDLKPSNVMVGAFGEVQVMDWGLAKVLRDGPAPAAHPQPAPAISAIRTVRSDPTGRSGDSETPVVGQTSAGSILGTAAYMSPEQAAGQVDSLDERCDVFGLGAILCEILTGKPPYVAKEEWRLLYMAGLGQLEEAYSRLDASDGDVDLVRLARDCLSPDAVSRPRDAAEVARRVAEYQQGVQDRLHQAERERAAAQAREEEARATVRAEHAKAQAERRARRQALGLTMALLLLIAAGGGGAWLWHQQRAEAAQRRQEADTRTRRAMAEARLMLTEARAVAPADAGKFHEATSLARGAQVLSQAGETSEEVRIQAEELAQAFSVEERQAQRDQQLLAALLEVRGPSEAAKFHRDNGGQMLLLPEPSAEEQFGVAFQAWGLDVDAIPTQEAAERLKGRPPAVLKEIVAGLDDWAQERRRQGMPKSFWRRPAALATALDDDTTSRRRQLCAVLESGRLARERVLGLLSVALRPVPILYDVSTRPERSRLQQWAQPAHLATAPALELLMLARALQEAGDEGTAERVLWSAAHVRLEVVLYNALGELLARKQDWSGAVECYATARDLRPGLREPLANALVNARRVGEGLALYERLVEERPDNPLLHYRRGNALYDQGHHKEAEAEYREALRLKPGFSEAHCGLGIALHAQSHHKEAVAEFHEALRLKPQYHEAYNNLGVALRHEGKDSEAEAAFCTALQLKPDCPEVHYNIGKALSEQGRYRKAEISFRETLRLKFDFPEAHWILGNLLATQGRYREAETEYREALRLKPDFPESHYNIFPEAHYSIGKALSEQGRYREAEINFRQALRLKPNFPEAHYNLAKALTEQGRYREAEAEYREVFRRKPDYSEARDNFSIALIAQGRYREAEAELRAYLQLKPDSPGAHLNLGVTLARQGRCKEANAALKAALYLWSDDPTYPYRYNTACLAVLAATSQAANADHLDARERARLRHQALDWLQADLAQWQKHAEESDAQQHARVRQVLGNWQHEPDLAGVRDEKAMDALPADERDAWKKLWADVAELARKAEEKK